MTVLLRTAAPLAAVLAASLGLCACGHKAGVPSQLGGVWTQADKDSIRLKFVPTTASEPGGVFLSISRSATGDDWFGPLVLRQAAADRWTFALETVEQTVAGGLRIQQPPSASDSPEYLIDKSGQMLVRASTHLVKPGERIEVRLSGADLVAHGLWVRQETSKWDASGQPVEQTVVRMESRFVRGGETAPPRAP